MCCPTIADKIARAEMLRDKRFFAAAGYSLFVLREFGIKNLSDGQLEKLLVHSLKVYPDTPGCSQKTACPVSLIDEALNHVKRALRWSGRSCHANRARAC